MACQELASNGYMVFALDHLDATCSYTESRNGSPEYFEYTGPHHDTRWSYYTQKVERRERECRGLIDEIAQANFASAALGFDKKVKIDEDRKRVEQRIDKSKVVTRLFKVFWIFMVMLNGL